MAWRYERQPSGVFLAVNTCKLCGTVYNNGNVASSLYCPECAKKVNREKTAERVRRYREKHKKRGEK
ncbi:MAG: hypothetical protein H6Q65_1158 [Firmicutes bacterium]|nr:hypothetical protein [Bacillota bacterium]